MADNGAAVTAIEDKFNVKAIESEAKGLYYLYDDERKYLGILTVRNKIPVYTILNQKQLRALQQELQDICEVVFGE